MRPEVDKNTLIKNFVIKATISAGVLLVLFVTAGLFYTWYMGQNITMSSIATPVSAADDYAEVKSVKPGENVAESLSIQSLTTPVMPGSNVAITVRTKPDSTCKISVIYNEIASVDSGLIDKTADEYGMVSWSWSVENSVPVGTWPAKVTCYYGEQWAVVIGHLEVVLQIE